MLDKKNIIFPAMCKRLLMVLVAICCCYCSMAQDSHYWSHKFGPKNSLLSGGDDATGTDNAAIINNPAGLGFSRHSSLSVTTNAYNLDNCKFKDGAGKGLDMRSVKPGIIPLILSATYRHPKLKRWTAGYAVIDKSRFNFKSTQRYDGRLNVLNDSYSPGSEEFVSQVDVQNDLSELWAGIAVAYHINDNLSIGVANFGAYREHSSKFQYVARVIANTPQPGVTLASTDLSYNISYFNVRNIFKLGVSAKFGNLAAGLTLTMPSFNMYSNATVSSDITGQNIQPDTAGGVRGDFTANDRQVKLKAPFKSPASLGLGVSHPLGKKTRIYCSAEYFFGLRSYTVINPRATDFIRPRGIVTTTSRDLLRVTDAAKPVFNIALGLQATLLPKYDLLCGVNTDRSYFSDAAGSSLSLTQAPLYHSTIGVMAKRAKSDIYLGVKMSYGRNVTKQIANINAPYDNLLLMGDSGDTYYRYYSVSCLLGYVHYLSN